MPTVLNVTVCLLLIGDGRDAYRAHALASIDKHLPPPDHIVEIDDRDHKLGFAGAIQAGWEQTLATGADYVFHLELDFVLQQSVPLDRMIGVLDRHHELAQLVLKRQPWNDLEKAAGGIVELHPDDYTERREGDDVWTEHRRFWSTNPSVYSTAWCRQGWPQQPHSEGMFTHRLLRDPLLRFGFWGGKHAPPIVEHIGHVRAGTGY